MKKTILVLVLVAMMLSVSVMASHDVAPKGIQKKFIDGYVPCFASTEKQCQQFDYDGDGVVGFSDMFGFLNKYTKMIK